MAGKVKDVSGNKYGHWTIVSFFGTKENGRPIWNCRCSCGTVRAIPLHRLTSGKSKSCGCSRIIPKDLTGQVFGHLKVISRDLERKSKRIHWNCLCACGTASSVDGASLRRGASRSCGCVHGKRPGDSARDAVITAYKNSAKKRGHHWSLSDNEMDSLFGGKCAYCGAIPSNLMVKRRGNGSFTYSGIDRIDNKVGYIAGNVVSCCRDCNRAKNNHSVDEFREWAVRLRDTFLKE